MRLHNRQIKKEFWNDKDLIKWPLGKRVAFEGLWCLADDSGCCEDDSWAIKIFIFPSPADADITPEIIALWLDEMAEQGKIVRYASQGKECFYITNFHKHQRIDNPSAPEVPLPIWITFQPYSSNPRAGKYTIIEQTEKEKLLPSEEVLTPDLQNSSNLNLNHNPNLNQEPPKEITLIPTDTTPIEDPTHAIFDHWNSRNIIQHRKIDEKTKRAISSSLKARSPDEVKYAIDIYAEILASKDHFFEYKWTLKEFLDRGIDRFQDREIAWSNFRKRGVTDGQRGSPSSNRQGFRDIPSSQEGLQNPDAWEWGEE